MAKQRASVLLIVLGLAIVLFLLYKSYSKTKEGFATAPVVPPVMSSPGIITTIAGTGQVGSTGDGGAATAAVLNAPRMVLADASGNIYIADTTNNKIRMITASTGIITTIAGTGAGGSTGDGGLAKSALLNAPYGMALDASGNLYIGDKNNNKIRMITASTGIITTIAGTGVVGSTGDGGLATSALLNAPQGVTIDLSGNIYIADTANNRLRMITKSTGIITTIAGNGTATLTIPPLTGNIPTSIACAVPQDIKVDINGNIYFTMGTNNLFMIAGSGTNPFPSTIISTFTKGYVYKLPILGNGTYGLSLDKFGNIYWAGYGGHVIYKLTPALGTVEKVAGSGGAPGNGGSTGNTNVAINNDGGSSLLGLLYYPFGCTLDTSGNIYIADTFNCRIRKVEYVQCVPNALSCTSLTNFVCAPGFSNSGTACVPCPAGWTCSGTVNTGCVAGTSCDQWSSNITSCSNCAVGSYNSSVGGICIKCPTNITSCSTSNFVCKPGFSNTGTDCVPCPNGFACSGTVNTPCAAGTFSLGGQTTCTNCLAGTYTPLTGQSNCITCPSNIASCTTTSYTCATGFSNTGTNCLGCPAGYSCSGTVNTPCAAGTYSLAGQTTCTPCAAGTYTSLTGQSACISCLPNSVCAAGGAQTTTTGISALICQPGFSNTGTSCVPCPNGFACSGTTNTACATGTYSGGGLVTCTPCTAGTYTNLTGQSVCIACPPNSVCANNGSSSTVTGLTSLTCSPSFSNTGTTCVSCPAGYACSGLANTACATGTYSGGGLNTCSNCGAGTYINATGQSACLSCPSGSTCSVGGTQATATGLSALVCQPSFSNTGTACAACPSGYGCSGLTNTACAINTYSSSGQVTCSNCSAGSYNTVTGSSNCGSSCPVPNSVACTSATSFTCAAGYYSNAGACTICPPGSTCAPGGSSYLPGQIAFSAMSGYVCTGNTCMHNQYASTLPKFSQGSIINMNDLIPGSNTAGINTSNCDKTNSCFYNWTVGSNVTPGPASANPCLALNAWYDFDSKMCVTGTGAAATSSCASNTVYSIGTNTCIQVKKPFNTQPPNTIGSPSLIKPGDFGNCKTSDQGDCIPFFKNSNSFTPMNPCRPPTKYDYTTQSCTTANPCCGLTVTAAASNPLCMPYITPTATYTAIAAKCPKGSTNICCSATKQTLAACAPYWTKGTSYQFNPSYNMVCAAGFQDYNNGIDTIADKRAKWLESRQLVNA